ncbi:MAG: hypothetical protein U5L76_03585 [Patescibacteria group bacterium]|nr:hypothetical protein [Patescibacteria group bacterium]
MINFILKHWPEIIAVAISLSALIVSIQAWHKSRAIYDIVKYKFPKNVGDSKTADDIRHEKALQDKLKTGKWQILHIYEQSANTLMIVLGKVKK